MVRSAYYEQFGKVCELKIGDIPPMLLGPDCVELSVAGAGINPVDYKAQHGYLAAAIETRFPVVPGWDVAGTITAIGPAVTDFQVGDSVFGYARMDLIEHGTAAEAMVAPARLLAAAPTTIDLITAAAVPLVGLTAYQLLTRLGIQRGETVLVHNASGGVGQFAVQLARLAGARVIGSSSPDNHAYLTGLGVEPVTYGPGLVDAVQKLAPAGIDVAVDLIGGDALEQSDAVLKPSGRVGSIADGEGARKRAGAYIFVHPSPADLTELARLIDSGDLKVDVAAHYPLADAAAAYQRLEEGHVRGKIILVP